MGAVDVQLVDMISYIGMAGNLMLVCGPVSELYKVSKGKSQVKPSGLMIFLIVFGILFNMLYLGLTVQPIPVWNFLQNFITIAVWLEIYKLTR